MIVDGLDTYVEILGEGEGVPTLFLHGFGGSADSFRPVYPLVKGRLITLDLWGFGKSELPEEFTVYDYAEKVADLLDALKIERVNLVAHSFGARVALVLMCYYPERVRRCVIADGAGLKPRRSLRTRWKIFRYKCYKRFARNFDPDRYGSADYLSLPPEMRKTFVNVVNEDLGFTLKYISCPVLLVWGEKDADTPLYMAKKLKRGLADCGLIIYENCGHFAYLEKTWDFAVTVNEFLK